METVYKICVLQNSDEKVKHFVKVTTNQPDYNGFMAIIFERFPQLKTVQFYMFYDGKLCVFKFFFRNISQNLMTNLLMRGKTMQIVRY